MPNSTGTKAIIRSGTLSPESLYQRAGKRLLDASIAFVALLLGAPLLALIALLVWIDSGRPIIFRQKRSGKGGAEFLLYKFRTMHNAAELRLSPDGSARVSKDDDRITRLGRLFREFGLDELPQLWNVLKGDMSLVGPRPYIPIHTEMLSEWSRRRLEIRPGVVCLTEISGRNLLPWSRRLELDIFYIENVSLRLDVSTLLRVIPVLILRRGVYSPQNECQEYFEGKKAIIKNNVDI
jgi:lipopolysaccharide/colanic/teichoic acid biosynthesis glycosyltransferase